MYPSILRVLCALASATAMSAATEIIAHRGASHDAPENTLASMRLGWEQGADAGELDIRLTRDGKIVLLHDATTARNIGVDRPVTEQTLAEVEKLDAGAWKGEKWKGERVPTLEAALATMPAGRRTFIEIKSGPEILPELRRVVETPRVDRSQLAIIAFNFEVAVQSKKQIHGVPVYWLASAKDKKTGKEWKLDELMEKAKAAGLDGLDLQYKMPIDADFIARMKAAGLKCYVWTVNDAAAARRLASVGVDGITTDRPAWLREQLR